MLYNGVGWVDKPNVSDGLWACWVFNPTYPLCHFFMHSTILAAKSGVIPIQKGKLTRRRACDSTDSTARRDNEVRLFFWIGMTK